MSTPNNFLGDDYSPGRGLAMMALGVLFLFLLYIVDRCVKLRRLTRQLQQDPAQMTPETLRELAETIGSELSSLRGSQRSTSPFPGVIRSVGHFQQNPPQSNSANTGETGHRLGGSTTRALDGASPGHIRNPRYS